MFNIRDMQEQALYCAVCKAGDEAMAQTVVCPGQQEPDAAWVGGAMERLEAQFPADTVKRIRMDCQCGYGMEEKLALLQELKAGASSLQEFADSEKAHAAGLYSEDGVLYLQFPFCPCPMLAEVKQLKTKTWCECTTGYSKVLFEQAFDCEFDVVLLKSIKAGDDICLMKLLPQNPLFD